MPEAFFRYADPSIRVTRIKERVLNRKHSEKEGWWLSESLVI